ncbi:hypothetical protein KIH74_34840 [Kineosporia sp. J2-2]|uniref:Uncharacterized protein n=1 Tax=Kineosporia corallincola TaxID=2835133 RepID=A0ABS5TTR2_9ACTN|nr:hypothetical protein [Kineosporia corallincola]MBT0774175.1 hypothetical protein [Kineosporia corallincola]
MHVTSIVIDAPGMLSSTDMVRDQDAALEMLQELYPHQAATCQRHDLVHRLREDGIMVRIQTHDLSALTDGGVQAGPYGDLRIIHGWLSQYHRRGDYIRPATAFEAAWSRASALLDNGNGVFGVYPLAGARKLPSLEPDGQEHGVGYLLYGSAAWSQALSSAEVHYYRVEDTPDTAVLPELQLPNPSFVEDRPRT